jgi:hypothetical protein
VATEGARFDIDLLAASLRADSGDVGAFVETLGSKLEETLAGHAKVLRWRPKLFGPKLVRKITIDTGGERLELTRDEHNVIETRRCRLSGGIVLKSEVVDTDAWMHAVGEILAAEAERSEQTRQALERLLTQ